MDCRVFVGLLGIGLTLGCVSPLVEQDEGPAECGASTPVGPGPEDADEGGGRDEQPTTCDRAGSRDEELVCEIAAIECTEQGSVLADDCQFDGYGDDESDAAIECMTRWLASGEQGRIEWSFSRTGYNQSLRVDRWVGVEGTPVYVLRALSGSWGAEAFGVPVTDEGEEDPIAAAAALCLEPGFIDGGPLIECMMDVFSGSPSLECEFVERPPTSTSDPSTSDPNSSGC